MGISLRDRGLEGVRILLQLKIFSLNAAWSGVCGGTCKSGGF